MKKIKFIIAITLLLGLIVTNCERDDLCSGETPTTPHLIIRFYDINNPDELKEVTDLQIQGEGNALLYGSTTSTDSIILPLKTTEDITRFVLHKDYDATDDTAGNKDIIEVTYTREEVYVSRACGYKSIFTNMQVIKETDTENWIQLIEYVNNPLTVENETAAQVYIFH